MKKVFLATSFSGKVDESTSKVLPEFRQFIASILEGLRREDIAVFAAVEHEGWMIVPDVPPEIGVQKDLDEIDAAATVIALVHDRPSAGVQFEIGYAAARGKQVILVRHESESALAYFNQGLISGGLATLVTYSNGARLTNRLLIAINAPE